MSTRRGPRGVTRLATCVAIVRRPHDTCAPSGPGAGVRRPRRTVQSGRIAPVGRRRGPSVLRRYRRPAIHVATMSPEPRLPCETPHRGRNSGMRALVPPTPPTVGPPNGRLRSQSASGVLSSTIRRAGDKHRQHMAGRRRGGRARTVRRRAGRRRGVTRLVGGCRVCPILVDPRTGGWSSDWVARDATGRPGAVGAARRIHRAPRRRTGSTTPGANAPDAGPTPNGVTQRPCP